MLLLKSPTASVSWKVTTLPRISVHSEVSDLVSSVDNVGKRVMVLSLHSDSAGTD